MHAKVRQWCCSVVMMAFVAAVPSPLAADSQVQDRVKFLVVIPSYNNNKVDANGRNWIERNLESVFCQQYTRWHVCYVNDCSTDGTGEMAEQYAKRRGMAHKCRFINNAQNKGGLANVYEVISDCSGRTVIVLLDGDDELYDATALRIVAREYKKNDAWITYGSYANFPIGTRGICRPIPPEVIAGNSFRKHPFVTSHLKTFYAKLFQKIKKIDLMRAGQFVGAGWDVVIMFPMLEMASLGHICYIDQYLYRYNINNPLSDFRIHPTEQSSNAGWARTLPPYAPLAALFPSEES